MEWRRYSPAEREACLAVFDSNTPPYFAPAERADFAAFLDEPDSEYFVLVDEAGVVRACGGFAVEEDEDGEPLASLTWGMVERGRHGTGLGTELVAGRLERIGDRVARIDTSQHTRGFYERFGFVAVEHEADGYGPGLDRYEMRRPRPGAL